MVLSQTTRRAGILLLLCLLGCGAEEEVRPPLYPVRGSLLINGKPAGGALLVLHPADGNFDARGSRPRAKVQADGSFQVSTYQDGDGAPVGEYQVAVLWFDNPDSSNPWDKLGGRYANPKTTEIRVSVGEGENQWEPIEIKNARMVPRPRRTGPDHDPVD